MQLVSPAKRNLSVTCRKNQRSNFPLVTWVWLWRTNLLTEVFWIHWQIGSKSESIWTDCLRFRLTMFDNLQIIDFPRRRRPPEISDKLKFVGHCQSRLELRGITRSVFTITKIWNYWNRSAPNWFIGVPSAKPFRAVCTGFILAEAIRNSMRHSLPPIMRRRNRSEHLSQAVEPSMLNA